AATGVPAHLVRLEGEDESEAGHEPLVGQRPAALARGRLLALSPASQLPQVLHQPQAQWGTCGSRLAGGEARTNSTRLGSHRYCTSLRNSGAPVGAGLPAMRPAQTAQDLLIKEWTSS